MFLKSLLCVYSNLFYEVSHGFKKFMKIVAMM